MAVFRSLKQFWNDSIKKFSSNSFHHFFIFFSDAWKKSKGLPENAISGFKITGLVLFDPNIIKYDKLYNTPNAAKEFAEKSTKDKIKTCDRVVFCQALQIFEEIIGDEYRKCFHKRFDENYNIEANDDKSKFWKFCRAMKLKITEAEPSNEDELFIQTFVTPDQSGIKPGPSGFEPGPSGINPGPRIKPGPSGINPGPSE